MNKCQAVNDNNQDDTAEIDVLTAMGFDGIQARRALEANNGDVDKALDNLCSAKYTGLSVRGNRSRKFSISKPPVRPAAAASTDDSSIVPLAAPNRDDTDSEPNDGAKRQPTPPSSSNPAASTTTQSPETSHRVGAIAVPGGGRRATDIEAGDYDSAYICDNTELVTARAIHPTPSHEPARTPSPELVTAELMPPESDDAGSNKEEKSPFWTRRCVLLVALLALLIVGGAIGGTLLALNNKATTEDIQLYLETIRPAGRNVGDRFADFCVVSRDGSTIAAGAEVGNYVKVYRHSGISWNQVGQTLHGSGQFGKAVDLNKDGSMMIVGAWNNDDKAKNAGHAKVFHLEGGKWKQVGGTLLGRAGDDRYGWYVSMSDDGRTVAASAIQGDAGGNEQAGYVRVFTLDANDKWMQLGDDIDGENKFEQNGRSMAMSANGRRLAVGTTKWNQETGIVRVFDFMDSSWQQAGMDLIGSLGGDWFGSGVALNVEGDVVAVGADGVKTPAGNKAGLVRVFHLEGHTWQQHG